MECFSCKAPATCRIVRNATGDYSESCETCADPYRQRPDFYIQSLTPVTPQEPVTIPENYLVHSGTVVDLPPAPESAPAPAPADGTDSPLHPGSPETARG